MAQSTTVLVLSRARDMIRDPAHWLQGAWRYEAPGGVVRRCAYQAVHEAAHDLALPDGAALKALARALGDGRRSPRRVIPAFNDRSGHKDVIALFDLALENA